MKKTPLFKTPYTAQVGDIVLLIKCPVFVRIIKSIDKNKVKFNDGTSIPLVSLYKKISQSEFEVTRNGRLIIPD